MSNPWRAAFRAHAAFAGARPDTRFDKRGRECGEVGILETAGGDGPRAMNEQTIKHAEAMLKDTENYPFIGDVIDQLKIGRTAFYRYFPTDRSNYRQD